MNNDDLIIFLLVSTLITGIFWMLQKIKQTLKKKHSSY